MARKGATKPPPQNQSAKFRFLAAISSLDADITLLEETILESTYVSIPPLNALSRKVLADDNTATLFEGTLVTTLAGGATPASGTKAEAQAMLLSTDDTTNAKGVLGRLILLDLFVAICYYNREYRC